MIFLDYGLLLYSVIKVIRGVREDVGKVERERRRRTNLPMRRSCGGSSELRIGGKDEIEHNLYEDV